ncbi:PREDICTED: melanoma-associated antigen 11-like [Chinchilla lanigera]|uniref:melanoma-associated antigen 11-like n=1 Tax=Chinchilla lanigera TaxID=34839 RepID=UPI000695B821|nr:PREDICTED: melanoma-associated antigen 11-like [Chinchilla lanigera]
MPVPVPENGEEGTAAAGSSVWSFSDTIIGPTPRPELGLWKLGSAQNHEGIFSPPTTVACTQRNQFSESSGRQKAEGSGPSHDMFFPHTLLSVLLNDKLCNLVSFLLRKYQKKEQVTMGEMLCMVHHDYCEHFPYIFRVLCESMCLGFGINMMEMDPTDHTYVLVPDLGLTYSGLLDNEDQIFQKVDLLIYILTVIFINGDRVSEEELRNNVKRWMILAQRGHNVNIQPWEFVTEDLVREQYLGYWQVYNSDSICYIYVWGLRAHAETTRMKVLEHVARLNSVDPRFYPHLYEQALREEML